MGISRKATTAPYESVFESTMAIKTIEKNFLNLWNFLQDSNPPGGHFIGIMAAVDCGPATRELSELFHVKSFFL